MSDESIAIGIDLGTTNSCVGVFRNGEVEIIRNEESRNITPSMVSFTDSQRFIGDSARDQEEYNSENTVYGIKRLIGRAFDDENIENDIKHWPFTVVNDNGKPAVKVSYMKREKILHPEAISAMVLEKMKSIAETHLGQPVKDAVITVPAYFDNNQRQATKAAGQIAGLNVLRLMNEPTAAAVAYGLDKKAGNRRNVLVYDLGGGTFDISVLCMDGGTFQVKSITGDTHLGGDDFDNRLVAHFARDIQNRLGKDIYSDKKALRRLSRQCEKAKIKLSKSTSASFEISSLIGGSDFRGTITREKFEELTQDLFDSTLETVKKAIADSGIEKSRIEDVVLVGGSTRIPIVERMLKNYFQRQKLNKGINPDEAVAVGAAIQAAQLSGVSSDKLKDLVLYDVVPLSLGVEIKGGRMSTIINRNQQIPITKSRNYTTTVDKQTRMNFQVYEGERMLTANNRLLGSMVLEGIPPEPRGYASIDVNFEIDEDCILHVKAKDRDSESSKYICIVNNARKLTDHQLNGLIADAEANRHVDRINSLRIEELNELQFYVQDIRSALDNEDFHRKVKPLQEQMVLQEVNKVATWLETSEGQSAPQQKYSEMRKQLETIWHPISIMVMESSRTVGADRPVLHLGD